MTQTPPEALFSLFCKQYAYEKGDLKVKEVIQKIEDSKKVNDYLGGLSVNEIKPSPKGLQILLNTIPYFMFSKAETLCLGGLSVLYRWQAANIISIDDIGLTKDSEISAAFILACSNTIHTGVNVFTRFFQAVDEYKPVTFDFDDF